MRSGFWFFLPMAHPATLLALSGQGLDGTFNSIVPPIYQSSIFRFEDVGVTKGYDYTRSGNPTRDTLETLLADLEGGAGAVATTSGMAAVSTVLATLDADAHVICSHDCYGGTERLLVTLAAQGKLSVSFVDLTDASAFAEALRPIAGEFAFIVFALGIIGTGMLAVPVLAGSAAYAIGEARNWPVGFSRRWQEAKAFYGTVALATLVGVILTFSSIDPIRALYWSAVLNGVIAVPVMVVTMLLASRADVMGRFAVRGWLRALGWLATALMGLAALGMCVT